jgi:phage pi2 protein 07
MRFLLAPQESVRIFRYNKKIKVMDVFEERKEIVQDVIDRLLVDPNYKKALLSLNKKYTGASTKNGVFRVIKPMNDVSRA